MEYTSSKQIPLHSLIVIIGPAKSGKTTLCHSKFPNYEIIDPEIIKKELIGDENRNDINHLVWNEVYRRISLKLSLGERVVIDSANLKKQNRINIANVATKMGIPVFYLIVNRSVKEKIKSELKKEQSIIEKQEEIFLENEKDILRGDNVAEVIDTRNQDFIVTTKFNKGNILDEIKKRGFNGITVMGDIHGCAQSMKQSITWALMRRHLIVFLGDIIDYGPNSIECIEEAYKVLTNGLGIMAIGNHERKIEKWLEQTKQGNIKVKLSDGNKVTTNAISGMAIPFRERFEMKFKTVLNLSRHHWIIGNAMFVHGAMDDDMWNIHTTRLFGKLENIALFGEIDSIEPFKEDGYPNRVYNWVENIRKGHMVFVGHDIRGTSKPMIINGKKGGEAVFMDCGSGKGGTFFSADVLFSDNGEAKIQNFIKN
jgi:predicted kinase